jgi:murein L,D-transpeptidase YcbB/YkuD
LFGHIRSAVKAFGGQAKLGQPCRQSESSALPRESNRQDGSMQAFRAPARPRGAQIADLRENVSSRRAAGVTGFIVALMLLAIPAYAQAAQANWWEGITGFGPPDYSNRRKDDSDRDRAERVAEPLDDLRSDATPWRSDEMIIAMEDAIQRYQAIAAAGGWPLVPLGRMMREGDDDERVPILRKRLQMSGDLQRRAAPYNNYTFDEELTQGVRRFQRRNGLRPTGRVERSTYPALNMTTEDRLAQLRLNLGRIRELLSQPIQDRYILVNVPAFQLEAVDRFEVQQRHRVIVGRTERPSPSVKATVRALNFFPYWRVPESVAHLDLIPHVQKEPGYLTQEKIRVFSSVDGPEVDPAAVDWGSPEAQKLKFRQDPGPQNALGLVRIDMPNDQTVYMHDTPMKPLFAQRSRAFSAGCVRVEDVFNLVDWIAHFEPGWELGRAQQIVAAGQPVDINLTRPVPVFFTYITAWAERDGTVVFRPDLYGRDGTAETIAEMDRDPNEPPPAPTLAP